jgi:hypothetical protein
MYMELLRDILRSYFIQLSLKSPTKAKSSKNSDASSALVVGGGKKTGPRFLMNVRVVKARPSRLFSSHNNAMRTGSAVIVQRCDFVIANGCSPLQDLIRCGFANELLTREPKDLTHVGVRLGA